MNRIAEYRRENTVLHEEYEAKLRTWLGKFGDAELAEKTPYFRDGVTCPEIWFRECNTFRPLFVLKEVSLGFDEVDKLPEYLETWGNPKCFEFVENPFDDVKVGSFKQWRRIARLAKGLEEIHNGEDACDYYKFNFDFEPGEAYNGTIKGYLNYGHRTANAVYNEIISKIAVLEIKKLGGGTTTGAKLSLATRYYTEHIAPFEDMICRQIELIDPTVIICLGREGGRCTSALLEQVRDKTGERLWIDGFHHTRTSNEDFYYEPLRKYRMCVCND